MKLRLLALLLVLANLGFYAWTQGWLDAVTGLSADGDREPERLARQFQPQVLRVVPPPDAAAAMTASAPTPALACLEAGPFSPAEAATAENLLQAALPAASWVRRSVEPAGADAAPRLALRIDRADPALVAQVAALTGDVKGQPIGKAFAPCAR